MAIRITCPECDKVLQLREAPPAGRKVKCSGCSHVFVPAIDEEATKPAKPNAPTKKSKDAEPPRKKSRADDEDAPKKRRRDEDDEVDEDEDEEEAPSKKKKKKKKAGASTVLYWVYRGVSVLGLCILVGVLIWILLNPRQAKLNDEADMEVTPGETRSRIIEPITKNQAVNVSATATSGQFNIYLFLDKDRAEVEKQIGMDKTTAKLLDSKLKTTDASLSAQIPANERAIVMLKCVGKKAEVKVKITN